MHCWLVITKNLNNLTQLIDDSGFNLSTDFVVAVFLDEANYLLYDIYNPLKERGGKLNITFLGFWNKFNELKLSLKQSKFSRRSNLHIIVWRVPYLSVSSILRFLN